MAKKTEDTAAKAEKKAKAAATKKPSKPADPAATRNLIRLLNILALLLAIAAFLLQLFAVLGHRWKWQVTNLQSIISPNYHYAQPNVYEDSRLDQDYGLFTRQVKLYANNDEQLGIWANTRFPRLDDGDAPLHRCLSQTSTLRGALLTCSSRVVSPEQCHCRRHAYWNFVIFFEILALILLGAAVLLTALLTTQYHGILKPAGAGVSLLTFLLLLISLILILSHLKRETQSFADAYPHIQKRLGDKLSVAPAPLRATRNKGSLLHQALRRQAHETYRAYPLLPGQHPYNDTHFQEYSQDAQGWSYKPYSSIVVQPIPYAPNSQRGRPFATLPPRRDTTTQPLYNEYGPLLSYDNVFDNTRAGLGWSSVLSILAMILALLLPLILIFSWLTDKKLTPKTNTATKRDYTSVPQEIPSDSTTVRTHSTTQDQTRNPGDVVINTQATGAHDNQSATPAPVLIQDVVIRGIQPTTQEQSIPVNAETQPTSYQA